MHTLNALDTHEGSLPFATASIPAQSPDACASARNGGPDLSATSPPLAAGAEDRCARSQLDAVPFTVVRLDRHGCIVDVNAAWRNFATHNDADEPTRAGVGLSYVEVCARAGDPTASFVAEHLTDLLARRSAGIDTIYACHSPTEARWFRLEARRLGEDDCGAIVVHTNVTAQRIAEECLRIQAAVSVALTQARPLLDVCHEVMTLVCEGLAWDLAAVWMPHETPAVLECAAVCTRAGFSAPVFEQATRTAAFAPGEGLPGNVYRERRAIWLDEFGACIRAPQLAAEGLRCGFAVPIQCDGEVLAVLEFFSVIDQHYRADVVDLLARIGLQLGAHELRTRAKAQAALAEAATARARAQLQALVECAPSYILIVGLDHRIQFINRVGPGVNLDDILGIPWLGLVPAADRARVQAIYDSVVRTGIPQAYEVHVTEPSSTWYGTHIGALRDGDEVVGVVLVSQDITELKRAQSESLAAQRLAAVGTLAAGVAHEINTPIQFVSDSMHFLNTAAADVFGLLAKYRALRRVVAQPAAAADVDQALADATEAEAEADLEYLIENVPKAFERCADGLSRVSTIVRALKEFAHPGGGQAASTDLNRAIGNTLIIARNEFRFVAELVTDLGELPPVVCVIADINQVVLNLVVNAAHAIGDVVAGTEHRGVLGVKTRHEGDFAVIEVSDTGTGIAAAARERVFDPFFTTKEVGKGTGQGLALAWTVVRDKHHGELTFDSEVGTGTTFTIRLPIAGIAPDRLNPKEHPTPC